MAATIYQVAQAAGVSPSTVSNVLNGRDGRMLPQTRQILNHYYKEEVARLEEIVGRKVPESWGRTV